MGPAALMEVIGVSLPRASMRSHRVSRHRLAAARQHTEVPFLGASLPGRASPTPLASVRLRTEPCLGPATPLIDAAPQSDALPRPSAACPRISAADQCSSLPRQLRLGSAAPLLDAAPRRTAWPRPRAAKPCFAITTRIPSRPMCGREKPGISTPLLNCAVPQQCFNARCLGPASISHTKAFRHPADLRCFSVFVDRVMEFIPRIIPGGR